MKLFKKLLPVALVLLLAVLILPGKAEAATEDGYTYTVSNGKATITKFSTSIGGDLIIPATLGGYPVTAIGNGAFFGNYAMTSVTIPEGVTTIGNQTFWGCNALTTVTIPDSVTTLGESLFRSCSNLTTVTLPQGLTTINAYTFYDCSNLASVTIPYGVTTIDGYAFHGCKKLNQVSLPDSVKTLGYGVFENCTALTSVTIPDSVTSLGGSQFYNCSALTSAVIGNGVTVIDRYTFTNCSALESVTIPAGVTEIGFAAFSDCNALTDVYYGSVEKAWEKIEILSSNEPLIQATKHFASVLPGDMDGDGEKTTSDAVYLLLSVMFGTEDYPVPAGTDLDFDGSGSLDTNDAVYLLLHVMFGAEDYPLCPNNDTVMTYEEFMTAEIGSTVCVETYVQATQSWWEDTIIAYAQSKDGAYYLYYMACSEADAAKLVPGTKIRVTGEKAEWAGVVEIINATFEFVDAAPYIAEPIDATAMTESQLKANMNKLASFKGLTVEKVERKDPEGADDIYLTLKNGDISIEFCVEIYLTDENSDVYKTAIALKKGDVVDVTGFLYWYEGPWPHITAITKTAA